MLIFIGVDFYGLAICVFESPPLSRS